MSNTALMSMICIALAAFIMNIITILTVAQRMFHTINEGETNV